MEQYNMDDIQDIIEQATLICQAWNHVPAFRMAQEIERMRKVLGISPNGKSNGKNDGVAPWECNT